MFYTTKPAERGGRGEGRCSFRSFVHPVVYRKAVAIVPLNCVRMNGYTKSSVGTTAHNDFAQCTCGTSV